MWDLIEKKRGIPKVVDLGGANAEKDAAVVGFVGKLGIDDYLSHVGGWPDLLHLIDDTLPPEPRAAEDDQYRPGGDYRITADGLTTQEYVRRPAPDGSGDLFLWEDRLPYGARVRSVSSLHALTDITPRVGFVTEQNTIRSVKPGEAVIELSWEATTVRRGPRRSRAPANCCWCRPPTGTGTGGRTSRMRSPCSPPTSRPRRGKEADGFRRAMKAHRAEETEQQDTWDTMGGYVPHPQRMAGVHRRRAGPRAHQGRRAREPSRRHREGDGRRVPVRRQRHLLGVLRCRQPAGWKDQVRQDWTTIADAFIANCPWGGDPRDRCDRSRDRAAPDRPLPVDHECRDLRRAVRWQELAGSFMMASTRPALPRGRSITCPAPRTTRSPRSSTRSPALPCSSSTTSPPKTSRQKDEEQSEKIEDLIRAKQNGNSKRRGTVDGGQRAKQLPPRAVQVFTAENNQVKASIRQRMIGIPLGTLDRSSKAAEHIQDLRDSPDQPLSRLTAAMIRFWVNIDPDDSKVNELREDYADLPVPSTWAEMHDIAQVGDPGREGDHGPQPR